MRILFRDILYQAALGVFFSEVSVQLHIQIVSAGERAVRAEQQQ